MDSQPATTPVAASDLISVLKALPDAAGRPFPSVVDAWLTDTSQLRDSRDSQLRSVTVG